MKIMDVIFGPKRQTQVVNKPRLVEDDGLYQAVWEAKKLPSPGAMNYAYETLGLAPFSPIGPTIRTRQPIIPMAQQQVVQTGQAVILQGMPTVSGQLVKGPLYDPATGTVGAPGEFQFNVPFDRHAIAPAGANTL